MAKENSRWLELIKMTSDVPENIKADTTCLGIILIIIILLDWDKEVFGAGNVLLEWINLEWNIIKRLKSQDNPKGAYQTISNNIKI